MSAGVLQRDGRDVADEAAGGGQDERVGVSGGEGVHLQNTQSDNSGEY